MVMGMGTLYQDALGVAARKAAACSTTPTEQTYMPKGISHPLLPKEIRLEDGAAVQAFESYLSKASGETIWTDYFFWQSPKQFRSSDDAKQVIAKFFADHSPKYTFDCHRSGQGIVCGEVNILSAARVYQIGANLDSNNFDGGGISVSDVQAARNAPVRGFSL